MAKALTPASESELAEMIADAAGGLALQGLGTKPIGHEVDGPVLSLQKFSGIIAYEPEELILEVRAATPLAEIEKLIAQRGQMLAFEPPDYSAVFGSPSSGTLGGVMACGLSGPRRIKAGAARDHILGIAGVTGQGLAFKSGARVVKNVTGYDMAKLMTSSFGTLAALTSIIVKVLPAPETEETLVFQGLSDFEAVKLMSAAMQSAGEVSGAAHVPGEGTYLRVDGIAPSVAFRRDRLIALLGQDAGVLEEAASRKLWKELRDLKPFRTLKSHALWRVSVTPSEAPALVAKLAEVLDLRSFYDWAGGLVWLAVAGAEDGGAAVIRGALASGHATLLRGPKAQVPVFQPQAPALAALTARLKQSFDPRAVLNPGRMYKGV